MKPKRPPFSDKASFFDESVTSRTEADAWRSDVIPRIGLPEKRRVLGFSTIRIESQRPSHWFEAIRTNHRRSVVQGRLYSIVRTLVPLSCELIVPASK